MMQDRSTQSSTCLNPTHGYLADGAKSGDCEAGEAFPPPIILFILGAPRLGLVKEVRGLR